MPANRSENVKVNEPSASMQPFVMLFVVIVAGLLIALPLLPAWSHNLSYSFTGARPRIYWYLARAAGIVALSILWLSMALGLSLTNKIARLWPGASTAFTLHEYVSLLGLTFAVYHGLVLMGDHFVDFSLPRLLVPFSIKYLTFWTGLGQLAFYVWLFVALSFYVRQRIGQKTWRKIHYLNFVTYVMGMSHGVFGGWDSDMGWAKAYYWISGLSLLGLLAYRIYTTIAQKNAARAKSVPQEIQPPQPIAVPASIPRISEKSADAPSVQPPELTPTLSAPVSENMEKQEPVPAPLQSAVIETAKAVASEPAPKQVATELPSARPVDDLILPKITVKLPLSPTIPAPRKAEKPGVIQQTVSPATDETVSKMIMQIKKKMLLNNPPSPWEKKIFNDGHYKDILGTQLTERLQVSLSEDE